MADEWAGSSTGIDGPARSAEAITPNDGADLPNTARAIYVGGTGDLAIVTVNGHTVTLAGVQGRDNLPTVRAAGACDRHDSNKPAGTLVNSRDRAALAEQLLGNPLFKEVFDSIESAAIETCIYAETDEKRAVSAMRVQAIRALRTDCQSMIDSIRERKGAIA